jgi:hypothetical protein
MQLLLDSVDLPPQPVVPVPTHWEQLDEATRVAALKILARLIARMRQRGRRRQEMTEHTKITANYLSRAVIVDLRQSSPAQVENNRESTDRQYALVHKATELGWPSERIVVTDEDLGLSRSGNVALRFCSSHRRSCTRLRWPRTWSLGVAPCAQQCRLAPPHRTCRALKHADRRRRRHLSSRASSMIVSCSGSRAP